MYYAAANARHKIYTGRVGKLEPELTPHFPNSPKLKTISAVENSQKLPLRLMPIITFVI